MTKLVFILVGVVIGILVFLAFILNQPVPTPSDAHIATQEYVDQAVKDATRPVAGSFSPTGGTQYRLFSSIGTANTSLTLSSFREPVSNLKYTMAYLGSDIEYGTLSPQSTNSEFVSFTGITQNADGTATLTGITRGLSRTPGSGGCVASSTLAQPHSGQSIFILSNPPCFYNEYTVARNAQTISGPWTFTRAPVGVTPTSTLQLATKGYVDGVAIAGAPNAQNAQTGIVRIATGAQAAAGSGGVNPYYVLSSAISNNDCSGTDNLIPVTSGNVLNANCINQAGNYTWTGQHIFSNLVTFTALTSFTNHVDLGSGTLTMRGVDYQMPPTLNASSTVLSHDASGNMYWVTVPTAVAATAPNTSSSAGATTTIYTIPIPAGTMGVNKSLVVRTMWNNPSLGANCVVQLDYGNGTANSTSTVSGGGVGAGDAPQYMESTAYATSTTGQVWGTLSTSATHSNTFTHVNMAIKSYLGFAVQPFTGTPDCTFVGATVQVLNQ